MDVVRRRMLTQKGEALLLCDSVHNLGQRFGDFADMSGIGDLSVIFEPVVAIPVPDYSRIPEGARRWTGTQANFMWHPLMWLPERLSNRRVLTNEGGQELIEPTSIWLIRVCLELTASAVYDSTSGTWLDVLSAADLDISQPETVAKVQAWLDGAADPELDGIDLEDLMLDTTDPDWAFDIAVDIAQDTRFASWAVVSNDLLSMTEYLTDGRVTEHDDALNIIRTVIDTAADTFSEVPSERGPEANSEFWTAVRASVDASTGTDDILGVSLPPIESYLTQIRDNYWKFWEGMPARLGIDAEEYADTTEE